MTISTLAKELKTSKKVIEKKSIKAFLEKELLNVNAELLRLAFKYGVKNIRGLDDLMKKGKIRETDESRDDFFYFDELEAKKKHLERLINNYAKSSQFSLSNFSE